MSLLDRFEQRLDRLVNGAFAKAFPSEVQPVEIAAALEREISDRAAVVSRERTVVPNAFTVDLAPVDHERLSGYAAVLSGELADLVRASLLATTNSTPESSGFAANPRPPSSRRRWWRPGRPTLRVRHPTNRLRRLTW
jgi:hypothetical protein